MGVAGILCMIRICSSSFSFFFFMFLPALYFASVHCFLHVHSFDTWYVEIAHPLAVFMTPNNLYKPRLFRLFTDALSSILSLFAVSLIVHVGHCAFCRCFPSFHTCMYVYLDTSMIQQNELCAVD